VVLNFVCGLGHGLAVMAAAASSWRAAVDAGSAPSAAARTLLKLFESSSS